MSRFVRFSTVLATLGLLTIAVPTFAQVKPLITISNSRINLVGRNPGAASDQADFASPGALLTVTVSYLCQPIQGVAIVLDFFNCASDVRLAAVQSYGDVTANCPFSTVQCATDINGVASFAVIGGRSGSAQHSPRCCRVYMDGYLVGAVNVGTFDQNNAGGVDGVDLALFALDMFGGLDPDRSDFNGDGLVNGADLSMFGNALFAGRSSASGVSICP